MSDGCIEDEVLRCLKNTTFARRDGAFKASKIDLSKVQDLKSVVGRVCAFRTIGQPKM
jgi:hypothetical protein